MTNDALDRLFANRAEILTVPEVADLLRMNRASVYKWMQDGVIPGYQRGRSWFIVRDELKEWMQAGTNQSLPEITSEDGRSRDADTK